MRHAHVLPGQPVAKLRGDAPAALLRTADHASGKGRAPRQRRTTGERTRWDTRGGALGVAHSGWLQIPMHAPRAGPAYFQI